MVKKFIYAALIILTVAVIWNFDLVRYGLSQAKGQIKIVWQARDIEVVLQDTQVPDSIKAGIRLVQEIKQYAVDSVGVNQSENYSTFYNQYGKDILWVVTACEPYGLKNKEWSFPLIGTFSYKGFFNYDWAIKEKANLDQQGYDTGIRTPSAWSTLGFFKDPILSNFLERDQGELANTIIHELTHGTVFIKDSLQFNENIATFVGNIGAANFLTYKYGPHSEEYQTYMDGLQDRELYTQHILQGADQLDSLYYSFTNSQDNSTKQELKANLIRQIMSNADRLNYKNTKRYHKLVTYYLKPENFPNNTYFMSFIRYQADLSELEKKYENEFNFNLKVFLQYLKDKYESI